ncbi:sensor domain-containing diguanylate cyclase [Chloroflexus sp.]|uniref:GGDEF domain-containing protein n=1 Tax=Chloroflexus sp. TaxID=1904827 RepID=UPI002ADD6F30|nr:sensor domain-containing diguanylate cyclase [Chloroflexus sp.]
MNHEASSEQYILVTDSGQILAVSDTAQSLLPYLLPLLPDLINGAEKDTLLLNGLTYWIHQHRLKSESGETYGLLISLQQTTTEQSSDLRLEAIALALSDKLEIDHVLKNVVRFAMDLLNADAGALPIYDPDTDRLLPGHLVNLPVDLIIPVIGKRRGLMWQIVHQGTSILIADYADHPAALPELVQVGVHSLLATPIIYGKTPLGILAMYRLRNEPFDESDRELLQAIARQTAIALHNARLYQRAIRNADERFALYQASVEISATLDLEQLYQVIYRATKRLVSHQRFAIAVPAENRMVEYVHIVTPSGRQASQQVPLHYGLAGYVLRFGVSLRLSGAQAIPEPAVPLLPEIEGDPAEGSLMVTPLIVGDRIIGALLVWNNRFDAYTITDLNALELLAATVAIALHNAFRFAQVQSLTITDFLTGLVNRHHFLQVLHQEMERTRRYRTPMSIAKIAIDNFQQIHNSYGHIIGDHLLREVSRRCRQHLRDVDILARYEGAEFGLILPETTYEQALIAAKRLHTLLATTPIMIDGQQINPTISIGVASFHPSVYPDPHSLIADADRALYLAKQQGRNRVCGVQELTNDAQP